MARSLSVWFGRFILVSFITFLIIFFSINGYFLLQPTYTTFDKEGGFTDEDIKVIKQISGVTSVEHFNDRSIDVYIRTYRIPKVRHEIFEKTGGYLEHVAGFSPPEMYKVFGLIRFGSIIYALPIALIFSLILLGLWYASTKKSD